jgi:hypothetical protein
MESAETRKRLGFRQATAVLKIVASKYPYESSDHSLPEK